MEFMGHGNETDFFIFCMYRLSKGTLKLIIMLF
jgi:hypothetical protein